MTTVGGLCPVCRRRVHPIDWNRWARVSAHMDSIGRDLCPASGEPWRITVAAAERRVS